MSGAAGALPRACAGAMGWPSGWQQQQQASARRSSPLCSPLLRRRREGEAAKKEVAEGEVPAEVAEGGQPAAAYEPEEEEVQMTLEEYEAVLAEKRAGLNQQREAAFKADAKQFSGAGALVGRGATARRRAFRELGAGRVDALSAAAICAAFTCRVVPLACPPTSPPCLPAPRPQA